MLPISSVSETTTALSFKDSESVYDYVQKRRRGYYFRRNNHDKYRQKILQAVQTRCVAALSENPIDIKGHDKIFTSTWMSMLQISFFHIWIIFFFNTCKIRFIDKIKKIHR